VSSIIVDDFYDNPHEIRKIALSDDEWYTPYIDEFDNDKWWSTVQIYKPDYLIDKIEKIIDDKIDIEHWNSGTAYNGRFHVKLEGSGEGLHNHIIDPGFGKSSFNGVGENGWSVVVFLTEKAPMENGIKTAIPMDDPPITIFNKPNFLNPIRSEEDVVVSNIFNRAVFFRGDLWHTGIDGFGDTIENGRMIQTFFLKGVNDIDE
tara:strand:- start:2266 stop:2877 length:612 start_codon:yes stop_codon:yes gene_type:complete